MLLLNNSLRNYEYDIKSTKNSDLEDLDWFSEKYYKYIEIDSYNDE